MGGLVHHPSPLVPIVLSIVIEVLPQAEIKVSLPIGKNIFTQLMILQLFIADRVSMKPPLLTAQHRHLALHGICRNCVARVAVANTKDSHLQWRVSVEVDKDFSR